MRLFLKLNLLKKPPKTETKNNHTETKTNKMKETEVLYPSYFRDKNDFYMFHTLWQGICETKTCPDKLNLS